jgi:hypothetical protein
MTVRLLYINTYTSTSLPFCMQHGLHAKQAARTTALICIPGSYVARRYTAQLSGVSWLLKRTAQLTRIAAADVPSASEHVSLADSWIRWPLYDTANVNAHRAVSATQTCTPVLQYIMSMDKDTMLL